jgi:hypothetical protein
MNVKGVPSVHSDELTLGMAMVPVRQSLRPVFPFHVLVALAVMLLFVKGRISVHFAAMAVATLVQALGSLGMEGLGRKH